MDNSKVDLRVPNEMPKDALEFAGRVRGWGTPTVPKGYKVTPEHGMILFCYGVSSDKTIKEFPTLLDPMDFIMGWAKKVSPREFKSTDSWDSDLDHDGHNEKAWRVYNEDWGHVAGQHGAYIAIKPVWGWYGK